MRKKTDTNAGDEPKHAWLIAPAKDLVENFSIDIIKALSEYTKAIERDAENEDSHDADGVFKVFDFQEACRVLTGSIQVSSKKVDLVYELTLSVRDLIENQNDDGASGGNAKRGGGKKKPMMQTSYDLVDLNKEIHDMTASLQKHEKDEKKLIDEIRMVDLIEAAEAAYERENCLVTKPSQFMFKLNYGQMNRTDEQILNAKSRPDVIGKVKDFDIKKADVNHEQQMVYTHDDYKRNVDQFTLPGARWIPDNKELAANFGVADIEVELDLEQEAERISAFGPFKDPLSGREVVAPPRWFVEQEAVRQKQEIESRAASRAMSRATARPFRDSQGTQGTQFSQRLSQPLIEKNRNNLNQFVSFVEGRINQNRPSTHLNTGLVDMVVDNFGGGGNENMMMDVDDFDAGGGAYDDDYQDDNDDDYVRDMSRRKERRAPAPWDDYEGANYDQWYTGDEDLPINRKPVKIMTKDPPTPMEAMLRKQRREARQIKTRRDEFMETHDYLQDFYYWRSAARINPNKDWKVEALRGAILGEKKRRAKERTAKIKEARQAAPRRRTQRTAVAVEDYEAALEGGVEQNGGRRTMGMEFDDVADEDLAAEVEISMLGGGGFDFDEEDVQPRGEMPPDNYDVPGGAGGPSVAGGPSFHQPPHPLRFDDIDDAELNCVINLPGNLLIDKALPLLKKFAENRTDREQMAYEMAKAYEDVDIAVSTLQEQVDQWHAKLESILEEGETRKEYEVHAIGRNVIDSYEREGEKKSLIDLVVGRPWYEISRYFLSCLFMCNTRNVMITENRELPLEQRVNTMQIELLNRRMHNEQFKEAGVLD